MRKLLFSFITLFLWSFMSQAATPQANVTPAQECKTYELKDFSFSVPNEFNKGSDWQCTESHYRFDSEAINLWDDGSEYGSSCTIDIDDTDASGITDVQQFANNLKIMRENMDETCDDPVVEGNVITMRSTEALQDDDGNDDGCNIYWQFAVFGGNQKMAIGIISYRDKEAKYYDDLVKTIVESIKFK